VLRYPESAVTLPPFVLSDAGQMVGVSAGTAAVVGLRRVRQTDAPTTAYLMVGQHCARDCAFCTQARHSHARSQFLSRVVWPLHPVEPALAAIAASFARGEIARCCLQVTVFPGYLRQTIALVQGLRSLCAVPICVSAVAPGTESMAALLHSGAERVSLALDAANERVYLATKGTDWKRRIGLLRRAARLFPGRIGTHLIAGLGETEHEMASILQEMVDAQVTVGLFSFTPVRGTVLQDRPLPPLQSYRRIQTARYLLSTGASRIESWRFSAGGQILSFGMARARLLEALASGRAFQTAGCPGCNRPCYNDRPGKAPYNYPRPLSVEETQAAISAALTDLEFD